MAAIALTTANDISIDIVERHIWDTQAAAVALVPGDVVGYDTAGKWTKTNIDGTTEAKYAAAYGVVVRKVAAGETVTAIRKGVLDGLDVSGIAYGGFVFLADAGGLADAAGTFATGRVGRVIPGRANLPTSSADKILFVDL